MLDPVLNYKIIDCGSKGIFKNIGGVIRMEIYGRSDIRKTNLFSIILRNVFCHAFNFAKILGSDLSARMN